MKLGQFAISLLIAAGLLAAVFAVICVVWRKARRGGTSSVAVLGAAYEFYNLEQRAAVETIVEQAADQQGEERRSAEPPDPGRPK